MDVLDAVELADVVNPDDVLVGDLARQEQLTLEPLFELLGLLRIPRDLRADHLQRDRDAKLPVERLIHRAHPTGPQQALDPVARPEWITDFEWTRRRVRLAFAAGFHAGQPRRLVVR